MKKRIARMLRALADRLAPQDGIYVAPTLGLNFVEPWPVPDGE